MRRPRRLSTGPLNKSKAGEDRCNPLLRPDMIALGRSPKRTLGNRFFYTFFGARVQRINTVKVAIKQ